MNVQLSRDFVAASERPAPPPPRAEALEGAIVGVFGNTLIGWVWDTTDPQRVVTVEVLGSDGYYTRVEADGYQDKLRETGKRDGSCAFSVTLPEDLLAEGAVTLIVVVAGTLHALRPDSGGDGRVLENWVAHQDKLLRGRLLVQRIYWDLLGSGATRDELAREVEQLDHDPINGLSALVQRLATMRAVAAVPMGSAAIVAGEPVHNRHDQATRRSEPAGHEGARDGLAPAPTAPGRGRADVRDTVTHPADRPGARSGAAHSLVQKINAGHRTRHILTRGDVARARALRSHMAVGDALSVFSLADCLRDTATLPARFVTDAMVAGWLARQDLQRRFQQPGDESCLYAYLAWYLIVRPLEEGLVLSREPTGPILHALSRTPADEDSPAAVCSALMMAAYSYAHRGDPHAAGGQPRGDAQTVAAWFLSEGAHRLHVSHAIPAGLRAALGSTRADGSSALLDWAAARMPAFDPVNTGAPPGIERIADWLDGCQHTQAGACWRDLLRESLITHGLARFDDPPAPALPAVCARLAALDRDTADIVLLDGQPEYMCESGLGERLLLQQEWYPVETTFVWSRPPISTLLFGVPGGRIDWIRIGLLFDRSPLPDRQVRIFLNHNLVWCGTVETASTGELVLACTRQCVAADSPNMLQVEVEEAFIPAEHIPHSSDHRRLGIGLRRVWVQRAEGLV